MSLSPLALVTLGAGAPTIGQFKLSPSPNVTTFNTNEGYLWYDGRYMKMISDTVSNIVQRFYTTLDTNLGIDSIESHRLVVSSRSHGTDGGSIWTDSIFSYTARILTKISSGSIFLDSNANGNTYDLRPQYSELWGDTNGVTRLLPTALAFYALRIWHAGENSPGIKQDTADTSGSRLMILSGGAGTYRVSYNLSCKCSSTDTLHVHVYRNSTQKSAISTENFFSSALDIQTQSASGLITFAVGDTVRLKASSSTNSETITVNHVNLTINRIGP
jgi:hypothetical protein